MKVIIAPNTFKGSLDAFRVAEAVRSGLAQSRLRATYHLFPVADGGDHTLEVMHDLIGGSIMESVVKGPLGKEVRAAWVWNENNNTALIETAKASGLNLLKENELNPEKANTFGTGQLIKNALEKGAKKIILGIGGSATVDAGLGMMQALGAKILDQNGGVPDSNTNPLLNIGDLSVDKIAERLHSCQITILCDVENPLLGKNGAARVFGPQKGADSQTVRKLENGMKQLNEIVLRKTGKDYSEVVGAGAAGGISVCLSAFFNAEMIGGVDFLIKQTDFIKQLKQADFLITAEGKADSQTLRGKGPAGVAQKAKQFGVPSILLAGKIEDPDLLDQTFDAVFSITSGPETLEAAVKNTALRLSETARQIGNLIAATRRRQE